jgi:hypothetical protein
MLHPRWSRHVVSLARPRFAPADRPAVAGVKEKVAALAPSGLVLVMDAKGNELVAQNADQPSPGCRRNSPTKLMFR